MKKSLTIVGVVISMGLVAGHGHSGFFDDLLKPPPKKEQTNKSKEGGKAPAPKPTKRT